MSNHLYLAITSYQNSEVLSISELSNDFSLFEKTRKHIMAYTDDASVEYITKLRNSLIILRNNFGTNAAKILTLMLEHHSDVYVISAIVSFMNGAVFPNTNITLYNKLVLIK